MSASRSSKSSVAPKKYVVAGSAKAVSPAKATSPTVAFAKVTSPKMASSSEAPSPKAASSSPVEPAVHPVLIETSKDPRYLQFLEIEAREDLIRDKARHNEPMEPYEGLIRMESGSQLGQTMYDANVQNYRKETVLDAHLVPSNCRSTFSTPDKVQTFTLPEDIAPFVVSAGGFWVNQLFGLRYELGGNVDNDLFIVGKCDPVQVTERILDHFRDNITFVMRTEHSITFHVSKYKPEYKAKMSDAEYKQEFARINNDDKLKPKEKIRMMKALVKSSVEKTTTGRPHTQIFQIVLRHYRNPAEVVLGFDIDSCRILMHQGQIWYTESFLHAVKHATNFVSLKRASTTYNKRLIKYWKRGFSIYIPYKPSVEHHIMVQRCPNGTQDSLIGLMSQIKNGTTGDNLFGSDYVLGTDKIRPGAYKLKKRGIRVYHKAGQQLPSGQREKIKFGYSFNQNVAIESAIELPEGLVPDLAIPRRIEFITTDPGRQFTASFHPLDLTPEIWMRIEA